MYTIIPASDVRPLPPRPDIDWERKRARKLVRMSGEKLKLDEARLLIARGYGFECWQKLERYYHDWALTNRLHAPSAGKLERAEAQVQDILREYQNRQQFTVQPPDVSGCGVRLCRLIPRFYGLSDQELFSSTLTVEEAQLVVARGWHFDSWSALRSACESYVEPERPPRDARPDRQSCMPVTFASMTNGSTDEERITRLFTDDRRMFRPITERTMYERGSTWRFLVQAIAGLPDPHKTLDWIRSLGIDVQGRLDILLLGDRMPLREPQPGTPRTMLPLATMTRALLDFGANPKWIAPNGFSVLEHAVVRYGSGKAVDVLLEHVTPRKAFWIAAGTGDVAMLQSFFRPNGDLSQSAHRDRPHFSLLGSIPFGGLDRPCASELHVMWEAFMIAVMNDRTNVIVALLERGLPVDFTPFWANALHYCIEYEKGDVANLLLSRGANPEFKAWPDQQSPREMAMRWLKQFPESTAAASIVNRKAAA